MKTRPPIYTRYYDLLGWLLDRTAKFPKNMRFGLVQKIERIALDLLELIVEAVYRRDRATLYVRVNLELEKLRVFLRLSHDRSLLSADQLRYAVGEIDEIGRMWHRWTGGQKTDTLNEADRKPV
ncbi:MAG: diversity-generating retroelement protein Avd [Lentisphaerae bacterium]|nr:diversity-generating retroelement protein Avd [Lentisphaerota bacterium]